MDNDVSGWILEFLLGQSSLDNRTLDNLIRVLPLPNNNPRLKKRLLLRKIEMDIKTSTISDRTIEFLEQIEELDLIEGSLEVSEAMKTAYCTLAMYCTAKSLQESSGDPKEKYTNAMSRIWSGRVREIEISEVAKTVGLVEDDLLHWVNDIEAGVLNADICENVLEKFRTLDVLDVLRRYVDDAKEKMGPSFIELACETISKDDELSKIMGLNSITNQIEDSTPTVSQDADVNTNSKGNEEAIQETRVLLLPKHKPAGPRCFRKPGTHRGAKIIDPMETHAYDSIPTPEVKKVQEALQISSFELHAAVKDPLPEALLIAESLKPNTTNDIEASSPSHDRKGKNLEPSGNDGRDDRITKPSLMERNSTAHTLEWSDSIDEEGSPTATKRPRLSSPRNKPASPLSVYKAAKLVKQRRRKRWSTLEEDTLRTGVQKYGKGNWKLILNEYRDVFEDRTEVDLKDKWRNLTRW
ncbi:hypothetical protein LXL04_036643 [Taraxacum kok-saghyz]